ncbi:putative DUF5626 domain-containing protein [Brevibacillus sp. IT-7CA2]|uniref:hypothetical protein n=1 Tax=Brevibacillus sp. IT-7CA2 TaxID=3026436 RepID=UPI0039E02A3B
MKKFISLMLVTLLVMLSSSFALAKTPSQSEGSTIYTPENASLSSEVSPTATALGVILCDDIDGDTAYCNWNIKVSDDYISYSAVWVIYELWNSSTGKWTTVDTDRFEYPVNPAVPIIENQSVFIADEPGYYRAKLGGTFTTVKNGVYVAGANNPSNFTIE